MFHADRARTEQFQGVDIDVLDVAAVSHGRGDGADALAGEQLGGDVLGVRFERRGVSPGSGIWPQRSSSMRRHSAGQSLCATSKCRPRLSKVCCRTFEPVRSERTRRKVK